ncbi:hypothetical protein GLP21_04665 [Photobacterium carnosum]|uniref:hypothetical protein n=1 Tax=Photobacterium carnosum TaxID=2023717 RepID=UPI001E37B9D9|nr:hypothetical protein [Photobacterium carnosum]MCD9547952.1 hypothetical protein [Photobacterium carnosum]MCF2305201.1 hypothetical protein [Photobacterium carnosum]
MKIKLISALIAGIILAGCGSDSDSDDNIDKDKGKPSVVLAFDGAINGMQATYSCDNGETGTTAGKTDGYGKVTIYNDTFADKPESCSIELSVPVGEKAIDMSNGKDMSKVAYSIPKGLIKAGQTDIAATPFTTLITKTMQETGDTDIQTAKDSVFTSLGLDSSLTEEQKEGMLTKPQETLATLDKTIAQDVVAKTVVLSDVLVTQKDDETVTVADIAAVTGTIAKDVIAKNPTYPKASEGSNDIIVIDVSDALADKDNFEQAAGGVVPPVIEEELTDPPVVPEADLPKPEKPPVDPTPPTPPPGTGGGDGSLTD